MLNRKRMKKRRNKYLNEAPSSAKPYGVLNKKQSKYGPLDDVDGEQPYYWYQGVGNITGTAQTNVIHQGVNVVYMNVQVVTIP